MIQLVRGGRGRPRLKPGCIVLTLIFSVCAAFAQEAPGTPARRLSPEEAVDMAVKNNLTLEASRVDTETKKRSSTYAWNTLVPSASLSGNMSRDNKVSETTITNPFPMTVEQPQWHMSGSFGVSLGINAAMFQNMKTLRLEYESGLITFDKAKAQLEQNVRKAYYDMLLMQERIDVLRESLATAQRQVDMTRANYQAGLVPELTWLQARVSMENTKSDLDNLEHQLILSNASFAMTLGLPYDTRFELVEIPGEVDFIPLDAAELISKAASERPDIQELRQNILILESNRKGAILESYTPSFSIGWTTGAAFTEDPWKDSWSDKNNWTHSGSLTLGLSFRLDSLFPFSANTQAVKKLNDQRRVLNINLAQSIRETEVGVYNTVLALEQARATAEAQKLTADLAERTYRLTEEAYRAGLREFLEVQNDALALRQARLNVLTQNYTYLKGLIDLEYAIGVPFGTLSSGRK